MIEVIFKLGHSHFKNRWKKRRWQGFVDYDREAAVHHLSPVQQVTRYELEKILEHPNQCYCHTDQADSTGTVLSVYFQFNDEEDLALFLLKNEFGLEAPVSIQQYNILK